MRALGTALALATVAAGVTLSPPAANAADSQPGVCTYTSAAYGANGWALYNLVCPSGTSRAGQAWAANPSTTVYGPTIYSNMGTTSTATLVGFTQRGSAVWATG